jgi:RNA polymerase sigma-70 factor, ECF subfamily
MVLGRGERERERVQVAKENRLTRSWKRRHDPLADPESLIRRVYAYAAYRIGPGPDAEDVTSEVFERAIKYEDSYDESKGDFIGWLLGIARRSVDQRLSEPSTFPLEPMPPAAPDDVEGEVVERVALGEALAELGDRDRELISLYYAGLNGGQIAHLLGAPRNTIDVALHRARARLRTILERQSREPTQTGTQSL